MTIIAALPERDVPLPVFAPRPQVDVGAVATAALEPENIPFGTAEALPDDGGDEIEAQADADVPLPTWRPDQKFENADATLMALAQPGSDRNPAIEEVAFTEESDADELEATIEENNQRLAVLSKPGGIEDAVASLDRDTKAAAMPAGVKTTPKSDRARAGATRPAPKPQVVAAQPEAARWALGGETELAYAAGGPSIEHLRSVPSEVYVSSFQRDTVVADASRFSGKAVTFMPVARFQN